MTGQHSGSGAESLCCPACLGALREDKGLQSHSLRCDSCSRVYPVQRGLPRLTLDAGAGAKVRSFGFQWRIRQSGWFERGTLYGLSADAERDNFFGGLGIRPEDLRHRLVVDVGCGDGFLLTILGQDPTARLLGMDLSASAELAAEKCRNLPNVTVVQADLFAPPLPPGSVDVVWCEGVLVHTGNPRRGFEKLAALVRPGGRLYVWVYSAERLTVYQRVRDFLRIAHKLPAPVLVALSYLLALPVAGVQRLFRGKRATRFQTAAFAMFDNLSPPIQTRHTAAELRSWFEACGFVDLLESGSVGMSGSRPREVKVEQP